MPAKSTPPSLFRASELALAASDNLIIARAFSPRSDHRAAFYKSEARSALELALSILTGANDGDPEPSGPAPVMRVAA